MIINYNCQDCKKYIVCDWRKILERILNDDTDMGKSICMELKYCEEFDEVK